MSPSMSHHKWLIVALVACCAVAAHAATTQLQLLGQWVDVPASATEQVAYDDVEKVAYLVGNKVLYVVDLSPAALLDAQGAPASPPRNVSLLTSVTLPTTLTDVVFCGGYLAVSAEGPTKVLPGSVTLFSRYRRSGVGSLEQLTQFTVGALPDQMEFSRDCTTILVSNEGEPSTYTPASLDNDPEGSVSVINLFFCNAYGGEGPYAYASEEAAIEGQYNDASTASGHGRHHHSRSEPYRSAPDYWKSRATPDCRGAQVYGSVRTARFTAWNNKASQLTAQGVKLTGINATVAQDLEPEYATFAAGERIAFVGLQENNAIAVLDVERAVITAIHGLGFKNHSLPYNALDPTDQPKEAKIGTWPVYGMYQPDEMRSFRCDGVDYVVTANEGDARSDWPGLKEDTRINASAVSNFLNATAFPDRSFTQLQNAGRLNVLTVGPPTKPYAPFSDPTNSGFFSKLFSFGARSFSIWRLNYPAGANEHGQRDTAATTLSLVYDSGDQLEQIIKANLYDIWNSNGRNASFDERSDDKGPEPEGMAIGPCATSPYVHDERGRASNDVEVNRRRRFANPKPQERLCLYLGTERTSVLFVYDITNPAAPVFQGFARPPQPTPSDASRLTAPEGIAFARYRPGYGQSFNIVLAAYEGIASGLGVYKVVQAP